MNKKQLKIILINVANVLYFIFLPILFILAYTSAPISMSIIITSCMMIIFVSQLFNHNKLTVFISAMYLVLGITYINFFIVGTMKDRYCIDVVTAKFYPQEPLMGKKMEEYAKCRNEFNVIEYIFK